MYKFRALTPERFDQLRKEIEEWQPDLVIIDTLSAYMGAARDMNRQNEVEEFLAELTEIAESAGCGVLAIAHLNKQSAEHPMYRVVGSIGFVAIRLIPREGSGEQGPACPCSREIQRRTKGSDDSFRNRRRWPR
jgi:archaellum biogenesis ATPase FlaH